MYYINNLGLAQLMTPPIYNIDDHYFASQNTKEFLCSRKKYGFSTLLVGIRSPLTLKELA
jgi:hypothetical protein